MSHGAVSPVRTILRPRRVSPITCSGRTPFTSSPCWSRPKSGPERHAELARPHRVELARARILHERVAEARPAVVHVEGGDPVAVALELVVRLELVQLDAET